MFHEDAVTASEVLGLSLTSRDKKASEPIPMAGFPWHGLEAQLRKMLRAGHKVTLVEQSEPDPGSKLMNRAVTRVYTPGSLYEESLIGSEETPLALYTKKVSLAAKKVQFLPALFAQRMLLVVRLLTVQPEMFKPSSLVVMTDGQGCSMNCSEFHLVNWY